MAADDPALDTVSLIDEAGRETSFALHDAFDVGGFTYYLVEGLDDPDLVLLLREAEGKLIALDGDEFDDVLAKLEAADEQASEDQ